MAAKNWTMNLSNHKCVHVLLFLVLTGFCAQLHVGAASCITAPSGLVAWWRADGNAFDSVGVANGSPSGGVSFTPGQVGSAFSFNGVDGAINVPDVPGLALTQSISIEAWVFVTNSPSVTGMILFRGDTRSGLDPYFIS